MINLPRSRSGRSALEVGSQTAEEAGALLLDQIGGERQLTYKQGSTNIVTDVDILVEKKVIALLQSEYPDFNILSEEDTVTTNNDSEFTWVIDPLDGTNNYINGIPFYCVSIALTNREETLLGLVYDPWKKELFAAEKGAGARLNGRPISVSKRKSLEGAFIGCDLGYDAEAGAKILEIIKGSWPQTCGIRVMGSSVLGQAYVACGRLGLYVHPHLYPWDVASGILLVREAGGKVTDWQGKPSTIHSSQILAGNGTLHREFMGLLKGRT